MDALELITSAPTVGAVYSLALYPVMSSHRAVPPETRHALGIGDGAGGSVGFADPEARLGFAYAPSRMTAFVRPELGVRADALIAATYASL